MSKETEEKIITDELSCSYFETLISQELDSALDEPERELLEKHLANCKHCYALLYDFKVIKEFAQKLSLEPLPTDTQIRLRNRLFKEVKHPIILDTFKKHN